MGCCLTSWFSKKQTALAISTTEAEYVSVRKACQQALWMKQALVDYGVRFLYIVSCVVTINPLSRLVFSPSSGRDDQSSVPHLVTPENKRIERYIYGLAPQIHIMVSTMITRNAGRRTAATRGRETSEQDGREGERSGDQAGSGRNGQGSGRAVTKPTTHYCGTSSSNVKQPWGSNKKPQEITSLMTTTRVQTRGREIAVGMIWENFKTLTREKFCPNNEMQKLKTEFYCHAMVGAGHAAYTDRFHELARLVPHLVTPENKRIERYIYGLALQIRTMVAATKPTTIQSVVLKARMLTDEAIRNGALKKITEKRGNNEESSRDGNVRNDNKRSRNGRAFATITNPVRKEYTGTTPKCPNCNYHHQPEAPCRLCTNYNNYGHIAKDCRVGPRVVNPLNARNLTAARRACIECGGTDHYKATCPRLN
ncbi:reverse transcriptase domain-containing protein [Tanacetum coccineum]|uniref:Reverse transcriptase domain-containing protein n=1 Tax=Tanacetum coccineum TaxID=301880 RepID=A0ABQ5GGR8_9ASTR